MRVKNEFFLMLAAAAAVVVVGHDVVARVRGRYAVDGRRRSDRGRHVSVGHVPVDDGSAAVHALRVDHHLLVVVVVVMVLRVVEHMVIAGLQRRVHLGSTALHTFEQRHRQQFQRHN